MVGHLERPVGGVVGDFQEERLAGILFNEVDGPLSEQVCRVPGDMGWLIVLEQIVFPLLVGMLVVVDEATLEAEEVVEPMRAGAELLPISQVPLADERRTIAVVLQKLRQRTPRRRQPLVTGRCT